MNKVMQLIFDTSSDASLTFEEYLKADQFMLNLILIHWVLVSTVTAYLFNGFLLGFIMGGVLYFTTLFTYHFYKGSQLFRYVVSLVLLTFSIIGIQQSLGRIEMHFHVFVALSFLIIYTDKKILTMASVFIVLHHVIFNYLQQFNIELLKTPIIVFNYGCGLDIVLFHVAMVVFEWIVLSIIVHDKSKDHCELIKTKNALESTNRELEFQKIALDEHAIISIADVKGNIIYANDKFCEICKYNRDEILGQNHRILKSDEHSAEFYKEIWHTITNGQIWHGDIKNFAKDGSHYWVSSCIIPFMGKHGKPNKYIYLFVRILLIIYRLKRMRLKLTKLNLNFSPQ